MPSVLTPIQNIKPHCKAGFEAYSRRKHVSNRVRDQTRKFIICIFSFTFFIYYIFFYIFVFYIFVFHIFAFYIFVFHFLAFYIFVFCSFELQT